MLEVFDIGGIKSMISPFMVRKSHKPTGPGLAA